MTSALRTVRWAPPAMAGVTLPVLAWPARMTPDSLDYGLDLTAWLADAGETIATVSASAATPSGSAALTISSVTASGNVVTLWIAGGTYGATYDVLVVVTTATRTVEFSVLLPVGAAASSQAPTYAVPLATTLVPGISRPDGVSITVTNGVISSTVASIPLATSTTLGAVIVGANIAVTAGTISIGSTQVIAALGYSPVQTVAGRTGAVTITHSDITDWSSATSGFLTGITSSQVTTALGFTPVQTVAGRSGAVTLTHSDITDWTSATSGFSYTLPAATSTTLGGVIGGANLTLSSGTLSLSSANVTGALGFTPYNATNPSGFITSSGAPVQSVAGRTGAVVLSSSDVSGLAASATTDTTNASNISSGTVGVARLPVATTSSLGVMEIGAGLNVAAGVASVAYGTTANTAAQGNDSRITGALSATTAASTYAPLASPALTGTPTVPTASVSTNTTQAASTAFVIGQAATATPLVDGTGAVGTSSLFARQDHVHPTDTTRAALASPTFTGTPAAPTAAVGTSTTQIATTAFVIGQAATATPIIDGTAAVGTSTTFARADHVHPTDTTRAPLASPAFTGSPTAPTPVSTDNSTLIATTAFVKAQSTTNPTQTVLTSGSGTYTVPAGAKWLRVRMVGGGAGGGGSATSHDTNGGTGGTTTFGSSFLTANGGTGIAEGPLGGTASIGTGATGIALQGGTGQGLPALGSGNAAGGQGAVSPFGGGGGGGNAINPGGAAIANSGSGGGGGGGAIYGGVGGGAGGFIDCIIASPAASYSYAVGAGGTAGAAGSGGYAGGAGGSGVIIIEEHYGS